MTSTTIPGHTGMSAARLRICYVLTSNGHDVYPDLTLLSVLSLRHGSPGARVTLLSDPTTLEVLRRSRHRVLDGADEILSVETPNGSEAFRNRYIKTSMHRYVRGAVLYLDADTLVRGDLSPIFSISASVAGAPNHGGSGDSAEIPARERAIYDRLSWRAPGRFYVNGGVLFFGDRPERQAFFECWHRKWQESATVTGRHHDQAALNSALHESGVDFAWMDPRYNAQVHARPQTAWGAVIWHMYVSEPHASPKTVVDRALARLRRKSSLSPARIAKLCRRSHPWLTNNPIDWIAVRSMRRRSGVLRSDSWERLWLADKYRGATRQIGREAVAGAFRSLKQLGPLRSVLDHVRRVMAQTRER